MGWNERGRDRKGKERVKEGKVKKARGEEENKDR
jgi:hypothetical protein